MKVQAAIFSTKVKVIGGLFHFDQPKATHFRPLPKGPTT
jgi:hypothetical protein